VPVGRHRSESPFEGDVSIIAPRTFRNRTITEALDRLATALDITRGQLSLY
jgi:hypothetical protein